MDCLHPVTISIPVAYGQDDIRNEKCSVPCGKCAACIVSFANEWRVRLQIEKEHCDNCYFVTLTYSDDTLPIDVFTDSFGAKHIIPYVCKRDCQNFFKRLRKKFENSKIRYYLVSEYGPTTLRPHYHFILFNLPLSSTSSLQREVEATKIIQECWNIGMITLDEVTDARISYVTKYLSCVTDLPEWYPKPFRLMSKRPGIGSSYLDKRNLIDWHRVNLACYYPQGDKKLRLPRYLKDKIFDDEMKLNIRENLSLYRQQKTSDDISLSTQLGYDNYVDYRHSTMDSFLRKFDKRLKKSRKDI